MKRVALINDLSGFGKCSLTAAIPVISVMGIQACPLPTAVLSSQTGFKDYFCDDYTDRMNYITDQWKKLDVSFEGIYSGYLAGSLQIEKVLYFLDKFQEQNTLYLADPVMGDHGRTYGMFSESFLVGMKILTLKADVLTPNLTELCLLADEDYTEMISHCLEEDYLQRIKAVCDKLLARSERKQTIVVTGIVREKSDRQYVGNFTVSAENSFYIETPYTGKSFSGTGDLFASVICGSLIKGLPIREAVEKACGFLQGAIEEASLENVLPFHGVNFEKYLSQLF